MGRRAGRGPTHEGPAPLPLSEAIRRIARSRDAAELRRAALEAVRELTGADEAALFLRTGDRCHLVGDGDDPRGGRSQPLDAGPAGRAILARRVVRAGDDGGEGPPACGGEAGRAAGDTVAAPMHSPDPVGALEVRWADRSAGSEQIETLECIAEVAGSALVSRSLIDELEHRERLYRAVVEDQIEFVVRWRPGGIRTFVNQAYCQAFGGTAAEFVGTSFLELVSPEDRRAVEEKIASLTSDSPVATDIHKVRLPDGGVGFQEWTDRALYDEEGRLLEYQSVGRDVTERVRVHEQLHRARSLETVARLIAGVAHDVNNLLTPILGSLDLLRLWGAERGEPVPNLEEMRAAASAVAELLRRLLAFGRTAHDRALVPLSLAKTVEELLPLVRSVLGTRVTLALDVRADSTVRANAGLIGQVLLNLASNARDAQPDGGRFEIAVDRLPAEGSAPPAELAVIACEDRGAGIPTELAARIFDPYFTTKGTRGTGLGLSSVQSIALDLRGDVRVAPASGGGTRFEILLPVWTG